MKRLCMWLVCAFLCLFGCVSAACAKTTPLMDDELFYFYTPEGLQFSDDSYEKKDGLLSVEIDDDETDWASAIAWTGEDNVSIVIGLKAPQGVNVGDWLMLKSGKNEAEALKFIEYAEKEPQFDDFWRIEQIDEATRRVRVSQRNGTPDLDFGIMVGEYLSSVEYMVPLTHEQVYVVGWYDNNQQLKPSIGYQKLSLAFTHTEKSAFHVKGPVKTPATRMTANIYGNQYVTSHPVDGVLTYVFACDETDNNPDNDISNAWVTTKIKAPEGATSYAFGNMKGRNTGTLEDGYTSGMGSSLNSFERAKSSNSAISFYKWNEETQQDELMETTQLQINFETSNNLPWPFYEYDDAKKNNEKPEIQPVPLERLKVENGAAKTGYDYRYDPSTGHLNTFYQRNSASNSSSAEGEFYYYVEPYQERDEETGEVIREAKYFKYTNMERSGGIFGKGTSTVADFSMEREWGGAAESVDNYPPCQLYEAFRKIKPTDNKIAIYYPGRFLPHYMANLMIIYWYENPDDEEPMYREYLWETTTPFVAVDYYRPTASESNLPKPVTRPHIIAPDGMDLKKVNLVVTTYHQEGDNAQHYELRMEDDNGNPVELAEGVTIYLPYPEGCDVNSFCTLRHYSSDLYSVHSPKLNGVPVIVTATEYGLKFETQTFSPFILSWEDEEEEAAAVPQTGDASHPGMMTVLLMLSAVVWLTLARRKAQNH
ncbi:MAG: hypothetical protein IJ354_03965 [Clostridia bacterium]|nr:hypothetical protein [Clostridia bacterium]